MRLACPLCSATLCEYAGGNLIVRHRGRLIAATTNGIQVLQCWRCGAVLDGERIRELVRKVGRENGQEGTQERPTS
jgi:ribosomal protein S27E